MKSQNKESQVKIQCEYTELVKLDRLKPHPKNRNTHSPEQIGRLSKLIKFQGFRHPVLVSRLSGYVVAGHGRVEAAQYLGIKDIPVDYQDFADEEAEYAFLVSDNAIASWAELDLSGINTDIGDLGPDFDIELLGIKDFTVEVADKLDPQCDEDEIPEHVEPKTKPGDIYQLGRHRLMCGDSTSLANIDQLKSGASIDMVFTDPPYGMFLDTDYDSMFAADENHNKTGKRFKEVKGDHDDFTPDLINSVFAAFPEAEEVFLWGADYYSELLPNRKDGSWVVWDNRCSEEMDRVSGNTFELCWSKQKHKRLIARILWSGHHGMQGGDTKARVHPTQKPTKLVEWFFENWGKQTKTVADIYGGSGATLIACEKTGRNCFMMELDPYYVSVIIERWQKYTGKEAFLIQEDGTQVPWSEVNAER